MPSSRTPGNNRKRPFIYLQPLRDEKKEDKKERNKPRAVDPCRDVKIPIKDAECHEDSPPTGENAIKCACLHRELARVAVRDALRHAEAPPRFWSPEMHKSFTAAFQALVSNDKGMVAEKLKNAAGLYCLAPESEKPENEQGKRKKLSAYIAPPEAQFVMTWQGKKKLDDYIKLRFEGSPNATLKDVLPTWLLNTNTTWNDSPPKDSEVLFNVFNWGEPLLPVIVVLPKWLLNTLPTWLLNWAWNDVLDKPRIRVKLVESKDPRTPKDPSKPKHPPKAASYHTDLCVQLYSDKDEPVSDPIKIPAGFTSKLSEPVSAFLFRIVEIQGGKAWELEDPDAKCEQSIASPSNSSEEKSEAEIVLEYKADQPMTVVVGPLTLLAFLVLGIFIGRFFKSELQLRLLKQLWNAAKEQFSITRVLQVLFLIVGVVLVVLPLWLTLERLEYAKEVRQFFSDVPVQAWLIPFALLLGFLLEMVGEMVVSWFRTNK